MSLADIDWSDPGLWAAGLRMLIHGLNGLWVCWCQSDACSWVSLKWPH